MKYFYLLLTLALHFVAVYRLKLLDNFSDIILIFVVSLFLGFIVRKTEKLKTLVGDFCLAPLLRLP
jgi:hypothetical protein